LLLTVPALTCFWSYNDDIAHHQRRYSKADLQDLADRSGLRIVSSHYFMFLLSPLLWLSRKFGPKIDDMTPEEQRSRLRKTHQTPPRLVNSLLAWVFGLETPLGLRVSFPWGTSLLCVFEKGSPN
jgi:hypothetical protein